MGDIELTPLERDALAKLVTMGSIRTNDGGMYDTLLSGLCSKPKDAPLVKWRVNPNSLMDGYISLYEPTLAGRHAIIFAE